MTQLSDREFVEELRRFRRWMRENGIRRKGYDLGSPYKRRRLVTPDKPEYDPRVTRLR